MIFKLIFIVTIIIIISKIIIVIIIIYNNNCHFNYFIKPKHYISVKQFFIALLLLGLWFLRK